MKNGILNELISTMRERIPQDMNLANTLADILCMGKEAVYRRLRGEVSFTIDEVALLSQKLGISIDQIVGSHVSNKVTFDLNLLHATSALESYYEIINRYLQIFDYVKTDNTIVPRKILVNKGAQPADKTTEVYTASNSLPFTLYSSYENLSKFRLCRWMYQNGDIKTPHSLEDMSVDERIVNVHKKLSESIRQCPKTFFIWDTNIFYSFVKEIKYFASLNLINKDDVMHLKEELLQLLGVVEHLSIKGEFSENKKVSFYLSNISFEATYSYIEKHDYQVSLLRVYSINSMDSQSSYICQMQRNWIQSLKRHSILVSESGEAQRIAFLQKQLEVINTL